MLTAVQAAALIAAIAFAVLAAAGVYVLVKLARLVSSNIAELTADVSMLTGAVRGLVGGPVGQIAGFSFGVRRAIALRRSGPDSARRVGGRAGGRPDPARQAVPADARTGPAALPAGRIRTSRRRTRRRAPR